MFLGIIKNSIMMILIFQVIFLFGCGKEPKDWEIEYDEFIPGFHGESVNFNKPMVYMRIYPSFSNDGYTPEEIKIGYQLMTESLANSLYEDTHELIKVNDDETFSIISSFWVRKDWWSGIFTSDLHLVIFEDSNNLKSFSLINIFALNSNRPDFDAYLYRGH